MEIPKAQVIKLMVNCTTTAVFGMRNSIKARTLTVSQKTLIPLEFQLSLKKTPKVLLKYYLLFCLARQKLSVFSHIFFSKNEKVQSSKLTTPHYDCFFMYRTEY